jgi:UDP:flavonoid glycosyltransferase YjiC (YdhE family)
MHVILVTVGTDGDVLPYIGLGAVLRSRGHQATLVASAHYEPMAHRHGLAFRALVSEAENRELFSHPDFWNPLKAAPLAARWGVRFIRRQYHLIWQLLTKDAVIVSSPGVFASAMVHEKSGAPLASLVLQPGLIPSSIAPPIMPGFTFLRHAPRPVWKVFWRGLDLVGAVLVGRKLNPLRASLGLKPVRRIFHDWLSPQLAIGLFPEWYGPPQNDWPRQMRLTEFPLFDGGQGSDLPSGLREFCRNGNPPVAFTFGTGMAHPEALFCAALEACEVSGLRGIFLTKHEKALPTPLSPSIYHSHFAPFHKLFPLCAAVVHHGGIGTVAEALATGTPQLIRPLCFDQFDNAARIQRLGVGAWVKPGCFDGRRIAEALKGLMTPETQARCRGIAERFNKNDGLRAAAEYVEKLALNVESSSKTTSVSARNA